MKPLSIKVTNTIEGKYSYETSARAHLDEPSLPDGCESCGAYKGSSFEIRLIYLIGFYNLDIDKVTFFCEKCFLREDAKHHRRPEEIITRKNSIIVAHIIGDDWFEYRLKEPCLPDGCESCGAHKGSSFENKIMNLICLNGQKDGRFFCQTCFKKRKPKDLNRQIVD